MILWTNPSFHPFVLNEKAFWNYNLRFVLIAIVNGFSCTCNYNLRSPPPSPASIAKAIIRQTRLAEAQTKHYQTMHSTKQSLKNLGSTSRCLMTPSCCCSFFTSIIWTWACYWMFAIKESVLFSFNCLTILNLGIRLALSRLLPVFF